MVRILLETLYLPANMLVARQYRVIDIRFGPHTLTAEDSLLPDLHNAVTLIE